MDKSIDQVVTEALAEYRRLIGVGEAFSAIVSLAELDNYISQQDTSDPDTRKWRNRLAEIQIESHAVSDALAKAGKQLERMLRIMGIGSQFEYEELMLLVVLRTELELFAEFINAHGLATKFDPTRADEELNELAKSRQHRAAFRRAKQAAKRNWAVPIASKWLDVSDVLS